MGTEGFSKATDLPEMNPIKGGKNEYFYLVAFLLIIPGLAMGRKSNEDGLRGEVKTTNRYAKMDLDERSKQLSQF